MNITVQCVISLVFFQGPISVVTAINNYASRRDGHISFQVGDEILVYGKDIDDNPSLWEGNVVRKSLFSVVGSAWITISAPIMA